MGAQWATPTRATRQTRSPTATILGQRRSPSEEWITIPVAALLDPALFDALQEQLEENRRRARIPRKGSRYVLQGWLVCAKCGYAYHGCTNASYRCSGSMSLPRFGGKRRCWNKEKNDLWA